MSQRPSTPRIGVDTRPAAVAAQPDRVSHQDFLDPATIAQLNAMDDFKRRHSKQNRDIVRDNANRLLVNRTLQEEIGRLHVTILQEREEKAAMAAELRRTREEMARIRSEGAREALDAILSSIPALKELRYQLGKASPPNSQQRMQSRKVDVEAWQAKPSVVSAGRPELEAVAETTERGSDSETGSATGAWATSRNRRRERSPALEQTSKRSSTRLPTASDDVTATLAPPVDPPRRPRRESGMFGRARSPEPDVGAETASRHVITTEPSPVEPVERRRISLTRRRRSMMLQAETESEEADVEVYASGVRPGTDKPVEVMASLEENEPLGASPVAAVSSGSSKSTSAPTSSRTEASSVLEADGDGEGRVPRRARKSVNYKEPSLHTKMRKPGPEEKAATPYVSGIALLPETPLSTATSRSRSTTPGASSSTRSVSAPMSIAGSLAGATGASPVNGVLEDDELDEDDSLEAAVSAVDARDAIVRRKSVLPKSRRVESELGVIKSSVASSLASRKPAAPSLPTVEPVRRRTVSATASTPSQFAGPSAISGTTRTPGPLARRPFTSVDNVATTLAPVSHAPAAAVSSALASTSSAAAPPTIARGKSAMLSRRDSEAPALAMAAARLQQQAAVATTKLTSASLESAVSAAAGVENQDDGAGDGKDALVDAAAARRAARRRSSLMRAGGA